jgi:ribosomal protein S18
LEESAISAIKNILNSFAIISGLKCNVEKSQIIITGTRNIPGYLLESGFSLTEKLKILGFDITKNSADLQNNFENAIKKIEKIGAFWSKFKLSLAGRILVAKSLMLSQLTYFGSIISLSQENIEKIEKIFKKFIIQNLKISEKDVTVPVTKGGLGFF